MLGLSSIQPHLTLPAFEWLEIQMHVHMEFHLICKGEPFTTLIALERHVFIGSMLRGNVTLEVNFVVEHFGTLITGDCWWQVKRCMALMVSFVVGFLSTNFARIKCAHISVSYSLVVH